MLCTLIVAGIGIFFPPPCYRTFSGETLGHFLRTGRDLPRRTIPRPAYHSSRSRSRPMGKEHSPPSSHHSPGPFRFAVSGVSGSDVVYSPHSGHPIRKTTLPAHALIRGEGRGPAHAYSLWIFGPLALCRSGARALPNGKSIPGMPDRVSVCKGIMHK